MLRGSLYSIDSFIGGSIHDVIVREGDKSVTREHLPKDVREILNLNLTEFVINDDDMARIISALNPQNAHGDDAISFRMVQFCANTVARPANTSRKKCTHTSKTNY